LESSDRQKTAEQYRDSGNLSKRHDLHARFSTNPKGWLPWVFEQFNFPSDACILELGCGPGALWKANAPRIPEGWDITLTDFSEGMIRDAQSVLADLARHFAFQVMDAQEITFPDARFDGVIANHMLYHVPDIPRTLGEIRRVLKPGGVFYAATNGRNNMRELWDLVGFGRSDAQRATAPFEIENGRDILSRFFGTIELRRYEDSLVIPEAEPLIDYVGSGMSFYDATEEQWRRIKERIRDEIRAKGQVTTKKTTGLFVCRD